MTTIIIIVLVTLLVMSLSVNRQRRKTISSLCDTLRFQIRVNEFKVYPTLKEIEEKDLLKHLEDDDWIAFHTDEERRGLGDKYLFWTSVKQLKTMRELSNQLQQEIEQQLLWGISKHSESI